MAARKDLVPAACIVALSLAGCAKHDAQAQGPPAVPVTTATAARRTIAITAALNGQIAPLQQSLLAFQQSGAITSVRVNVGDRVRAGELLATVDDSVLRAQLAQDEALIAESNARAASSAVGVPITRTTTSAGLQAARTSVTADRAALANDTLVYHQDITLYGQGYVSRTSLEQSRAAFVAAQQRVAADEQSLRAAQANTMQTEEASAGARADLAAARAAAAQANTLRAQIAQTFLHAPFDGVITERLMDPGAIAGPATPVLQISAIDTVYVDFNVPDDLLSYAAGGTHVTFSTPSLPGRTFVGTIHNVNAVPSQGTLSYLAQIRQPNPGDLLRGGMLVTVVLTEARHADAIVVPRTAIARTPKGQTVVFTVRAGKAHAVPVRLGLQTGTESQVVSPQIGPGTPVVDQPPPTLREGATVLAAAAAPAAASARP